MVNRKFYCYLAPKNDPYNNAAVREITTIALNYAEAESRMVEFMNDDEYIKRIEQDL